MCAVYPSAADVHLCCTVQASGWVAASRLICCWTPEETRGASLGSLAFAARVNRPTSKLLTAPQVCHINAAYQQATSLSFHNPVVEVLFTYNECHAHVLLNTGCHHHELSHASMNACCVSIISGCAPVAAAAFLRSVLVLIISSCYLLL